MVWNYFIENIRYSRRVLEVSIMYSLHTEYFTSVANYSDSIVLLIELLTVGPLFSLFAVLSLGPMQESAGQDHGSFR